MVGCWKVTPAINRESRGKASEEFGTRITATATVAENARPVKPMAHLAWRSPSSPASERLASPPMKFAAAATKNGRDESRSWDSL
jgi:hypothetical protein